MSPGAVLTKGGEGRKKKKERKKKLIPRIFSRRKPVIQQKKAMDDFVQLTDMRITAAGKRQLPNLRLLSLPAARNITHSYSFFLGNPAPREDPMLSKRSYL